MPIPKAKTAGRVPRQLVRERVLEEIRNAILSGTLLPGERLDEASLREWLGVSATPIRQALHALVLEGLVESAPQSHTIVATPRPEHVVENMQAMGVLLLGVTALALSAIDDGDRGVLEKHAAHAARLIAKRDIEASSKAAGEYFALLMQRCPNVVLVDLTRRVGTSLSYHIFTAHQALGDSIDVVADAYRALPSAIRENDYAGVLAATRQAFLIDHGGTPSPSSGRPRASSPPQPS